MTLREASERLELTVSSLNRIENARTPLSVHLAKSMMEVYLWEDDDVLDLIRASRRRGWWGQYGISDRDYIAIESGAGRLRTFEPDLVPGLLQTSDYASALFAAARVRRSREWIDNQLAVRLIRQERLVDEDNPLQLHAVINEFVLRKPVGGAAVMRAQLRHLVLVTELPTVTLQVLPASAVTTDAIYGAFVILDFPSSPSVVHLQHVLGPERKDKPEQVAATRLRFDHLRSLALDPAESVGVIEWVANRLWATE